MKRPGSTSSKPKGTSSVFVFLLWFAIKIFDIKAKGNPIEYDEKFKKLKPPYLLLSNHGSFFDFPIAAKANYPASNSWIISVEEYVGREWLIDQIGGIRKRKFTSELFVIKQMLDVLRRQKRVCVMYPEARYSIAGINERMNDGIGKLVKLAGCPVVQIMEHGNYIAEPQWNKKEGAKNQIKTRVSVLVSKDEVEQLSAEEIQAKIEHAFVYDDYKYQLENKIKNESPTRADYIERILYKCPACGKEFEMEGRGTHLSCKACGSSWEMNEYGQMHRENGDEIFTHIPDWYRWERKRVIEEVEAGSYKFEDDVRIEHLDQDPPKFRPIGTVHFTQDENGFTLFGKLDNGEDFYLNRAAKSMPSVHIEYDFYKNGVEKQGPAIDIATTKDSYFVFPKNKGDHLTKIHFAAEALYDKAMRNK